MTFDKLERLASWLNQPGHAAALWLGKYSVAAAWLGLFLAVITPPHGSGISLCWFQSSTGVPCPGCGMTRSLSCGLRGMVLESWHYHPLGFFVLLLFLAVAIQSLLPRSARKQIERFIQARAFMFNSLYFLFVIAFVGFGTLRALAHLGSAWANHGHSFTF